MRVWFIVLLLLGALAAPAQEWIGEKDFLTEYEVEQIRLAQEPNDRVAAYLHFAALRLELVKQLMAKEEAGRGAKVHDNIEQYGRIMEAIDMVIDDALVRDADLSKALETLVDREKSFLGDLLKIRASEPDDLWRYEFVLEDAIDITNDSIELATADLGERKRDVIAADETEEAERKATMSAERAADVEKAETKQAAKEEEFESKRPSLLKKGETLENVNRPDSSKKKK